MSTDPEDIKGPDWEKELADAASRVKRRRKSPDGNKLFLWTAGGAALGFFIIWPTAIGFAARMMPGTDTTAIIAQAIGCCGGAILGGGVGGVVGRELGKSHIKDQKKL